jgi:hypothetical protein
MTHEAAGTLWKAAAVAVFIAILVLIATRDSLYTWIALVIVFLGFGVYEAMHSKKPGQ